MVGLAGLASNDVPFSFLSEGDDTQIYQCVKNYICLGQNELARALLRQMMEQNEEGTNFLLNSLLTRGLPSQCDLLETKSQIDTLLMLLQEYRLHQSEENKFAHNFLFLRLHFDKAVIRALHGVQISPIISEFFKALRTQYHKANHGENQTESLHVPELTPEMLKTLPTFLKTRYKHIEHIIKHIVHCPKSVEEEQAIIEKNQEKLLCATLDFAEEILMKEDPHDIQKYVSICNIIPNVKELSAFSCTRLENWIRKLLRHSQSPSCKSTSFRKEIYEKVFSSGNSSLVRVVAVIEDELLLEHECEVYGKSEGSKSIRVYAGEGENSFWCRLASFCRIQDENMIEHIINVGMNLLKEGKLESGLPLLEKFRELKPLLLLLSSPFYAKDMKGMKMVMDSLSPEPIIYHVEEAGMVSIYPDGIPMDQRLVDASLLLNFQMKVSKWISKKVYRFYLSGDLSCTQGSYPGPSDEMEFGTSMEHEEESVQRIRSRILIDMKEKSLLQILCKAFLPEQIEMEDFSPFLIVQPLDGWTVGHYKKKSFLEISWFCIEREMKQSSELWKTSKFLTSADFSCYFTPVKKKVKKLLFDIFHVPLKVQILRSICSFLFLPKPLPSSSSLEYDAIDMFYIRDLLKLLMKGVTHCRSGTVPLGGEETAILLSLDSVIQEGQWRLYVIERCIVTYFTKGESHRSVWELWSCSRSSLLVHCLSRHHFDLCEEIIQYFALSGPLSLIPMQTKEIMEAREAIETSDHPNSLWEKMVSMNQLPSFYIDLLATSDTKGKLLILPEVAGENISDSHFLHTFRDLQKLCKIPIYDLLRTSTFASSSKASSSLFPSAADWENKKVIWELYDMLIIDQDDTENIILSRDQYESLIASKNKLESNSYLARFITMLEALIKILYHPNDKEISLQFLMSSPDELIGQYVYKQGNYEIAQALAHFFRKDLMMGVFNSLKRQKNIKGSGIMLQESIMDYFRSQNSQFAFFAVLFTFPIDSSPYSFISYAYSIVHELEGKNGGEKPGKNLILSRWFSTFLLPLFHSSLSELHLKNPYTIETLHNELQRSGVPSEIDFNSSPKICAILEPVLSTVFLHTEQRERYYTMLIEYLMERKEFQAAQKLAEMALPSGPPDALLISFIRANPNESWRYIVKLKNMKVACSFAFSQMEFWELEGCCTVFDFLHHHIPSDSSIVLPKHQIKCIVEELCIYSEIMGIGANCAEINVEAWQTIARMCRHNTEQIVHVLTKEGQFEVARKVAIRFAPESAVQRSIEENFLLVRMMSMDPKEYSTLVPILLHQLGPSALKIAEAILEKVSSEIPSLALPTSPLPSKSIIIGFQKKVEYFLSIQSFLVQYILSTCVDECFLEHFTLHYLLDKQKGLRILCAIPLEVVERYLHLSNFPSLIIEGLILSEQCALLTTLLDQFPSLRDDKMILFYSVKAMSVCDEQTVKKQRGDSPMRNVSSHSSLRQIRRDFISARQSPSDRVSSRSLRKLVVIDSSATQLQSLPVPFTGDSSDQDIRDTFIFTSAPNIRLFKALISLSTDGKSAGTKCLELANSLSLRLSTSSDPLFLTDQIKQVLLTGKYVLLETGLSSELCDSLLSYVTLLQALIMARRSFSYSLMEFHNQKKMIQLRDRLISEDYLQLALDVSATCRLDPAPVYSSWGLSLLRRGNYTKAKEIFKDCLRENMAEKVNEGQRALKSNQMQAQQQQSRMVNDIVRILEKKAPKDSKDVREALRRSLRKKIVPLPIPAIPNEFKPTVRKVSLNQLDTERYMQCIYYLTKFGRSEDLLAFWLRHESYEDALRFILQKNLSSKSFIDVSMRVIRAKGITHLHEGIIAKIDPELDLCKDYLLRLCASLSSTKALDALLQTQIFMKDFIRAGLTCVSKAKRELDNIPQQQNYLQIASDSFKAAIEDGHCRMDGSPLSESEVNDLLQSVELQAKVLILFTNIFAEKIPASLCSCTILSGDAASISTLCEAIISLGHFRVAYSILQEFPHLVDKNEVYFLACVKIARSRKYTTLIDVLRLIRSTGSSDMDVNRIMKACAVVFIRGGDTKSAEKLIAKLSTIDSKVEAFLECGNLNAAFSEASNSNRVDLIPSIQEEAQKRGNKNVYKSCAKYLRKSTH